jgi:hypothetical protein
MTASAQIQSSIHAELASHLRFERMLIFGSVLEPDSQPHAKLLDLHMLVMHGGQERTRREFSKLIAAAGLRLERTTPLAGSCLIECRR